MTEFLMVCSEEALEPWQMDTEVIEIDDDDDDPIFVSEVLWVDDSPQKNGPNFVRKCTRPNCAGRKCAPPVSVGGGDACVLPASNAKAPSTAQPDSGHTSIPQSGLQTVALSSTGPVPESRSPQHVISNNQISNSGLITPLVPQDLAGTSFTLLPAGYPMLQQGAVLNLPSKQSPSQPKQPAAQLMNTIPQPTAQSSLAIPQPTAQSSLAIPQPTTQSSLAIPQPTAQSSIITLHKATDLRFFTPLGTDYPAGTFFTLLPAGYPMLQQGDVLNLPSKQSPSQPKQPAAQLMNTIPQPTAQTVPITLQLTAQPSAVTLVKKHINFQSTPESLSKPAAQPSPANLPTAAQPSSAIQQTAAQPSSANLQTAARPSSANLQTAAQPSSANLQTAARPSSANLQMAAQPSSANLQTAARPSPANLQTAAQPSSANLQTAARPSSANLQMAAQPSPANLQTAAQPSPANLQTAAQPSPANLQTAAQPRPANLQTASQPSPANLQAAARPSPANLQTAARPSPANLQTAAQPSPANLQTAAQSRPANLQTAAQPSPANLQTAAQPRPANLQTAAQPRPANLQTAAQPSPANLQTAAQPNSANLQTAARPSPANLQTATQPRPANLQTAAQPRPANLQTAAQPSPANLQTAAQPSPANVQTAARPSPANLQTAAQPSSAILQTAAQASPANLQTAVQPSSANLQTAAQPSVVPQKWFVQSGPGTLQCTQTGALTIRLKLLCPQSQQATPTSQVTREMCSPGAATPDPEKRDSRPQPMNSDFKRQMCQLETTTCPDDTLELKPTGNKCPSCNFLFSSPRLLRRHMKECCFHLINSVFPCTRPTPASQNRIYDQGKLVMSVNEFYYGNHSGNRMVAEKPKTGIPFTCPSCFRVLKNNIGFMNHMRHHLELLWQSRESQDSHTACQHCYRRYSTPCRLHLHTERAHTQYESTTTCKICELAFETELILLEHMRDTHKPGEMPYVCQICNYRSSFFSEVENHFRSEHENTKQLLCPFCLKVQESGPVYGKHYMKHQDKEIYQCEKCRLNFLSNVERVAHDALFHRTFKKPKILKGLPLGTEVVIRTSVSATPHSDALMSKSSPHSANARPPKDPPCPPPEHPSPHPLRKGHRAPWSLSYPLGEHTCVECSAKIRDFSDHFMAVMFCDECGYRSSCFKSLQDHRIRLHGALPRDGLREKPMKSQGVLRGITSLECLNCDFVTDPSNGNLMTKHLLDRPYHTCRVIGEKGPCDQIQIKSEPEFFTGEQVDYSKNIKSENLSEDLSISPVLMESILDYDISPGSSDAYDNSLGSSDAVFGDPGAENSTESGDGETDRMKIKEEQAW